MKHRQIAIHFMIGTAFAMKAEWKNIVEVQTFYPKAEAVGNLTVFNIKGNHYRLIVDIVYSS